MNPIRSCVVCGGPLGLSWLVDHFNERACRHCEGEPRCWSCNSITGGNGLRARTVLTNGRARCARCSTGAVDLQSDVARVVRLVRPLLHSYGIQLPNRVRVTLAATDELDQQIPGAHGITTFEHQFGRNRVTDLKIAAGLPATAFGRILAHEMGHGWLAGCPGQRPQAEEEGICELVGSWWLRHRGGRLAAYLLRNMRSNPDPIYGAGFREVARQAHGKSPDQVVHLVVRTGHI